MDSAWRSVGSHSIRVVEDRVELCQRGIVTLADVLEYFRCVEGVSERYGYSLSLFDQHQAAGIEPGARSYMGQRSRVLSSPTALASIGASLTLRTLARLIIRAINMMREPPLLIGFFATESEARAYLAKHRREFRADLRLSHDDQPPA